MQMVNVRFWWQSLLQSSFYNYTVLNREEAQRSIPTTTEAENRPERDAATQHCVISRRRN